MYILCTKFAFKGQKVKKLIALGLSAIVASLCVLTFSGCGDDAEAKVKKYKKLKEEGKI